MMMPQSLLNIQSHLSKLKCLSLTRKIVFKIIPEPQSAKVIFNGQEIVLTRHCMQWEGFFPNATEGKHHITVIPFRGKPTQLEIEFFGMGFSSDLDLDDF